MDDSRTEQGIFNPTVATEFLEEWFISLAASNAANISLAEENSQLINFKSRKFVEMIFLICEKLKQPIEVRYLALEIFSRFMLKHIKELHSHVMTVQVDNSKRFTEWNRIMFRIEKQVFLRAASCIQIASKLVSHYKVITSAKLCCLIKEAGYNFNSTSILNSELRILKILNYQVNIPSAVAYLDFFLQVLVHNEPMINADLLRTVSLKVMDIICLQQREAYLYLYLSVSKVQNINRAQFATVENDLMYFAVTIISCAAVLIDDKDSVKITKHLHIITAIPQKDITNFTRILIPFILN